jgi:isopenicillin-N N-acyltransferase-like protein
MSEEIGFQHGKHLATQIHRNIEFYKSMFLNNLGDESAILNAAEVFKENIRNYNPDYILEIDHIALGAEVREPLWLYAINARTELSLMSGMNECNAIVCPKHNLLAQTWDWAQKLEGNFVIMRISFPDGHQILQLTEAGMIGKIGINNQGLGVTLNYLYDENTSFYTVPIHILLRCVLECRTLKEAKIAARKSCNGKASNLIIAQSGKAINIEFAGNLIHFFDVDDVEYVHTNHFLHAKPPKIVVEESYINSVTRRRTALEKLELLQMSTPQAVTEVLSDRTNGKNAILASYKPDPIEMLGDYGTLATIVMDLNDRTMMLREGNPANQSFTIGAFEKYCFD